MSFAAHRARILRPEDAPLFEDITAIDLDPGGLGAGTWYYRVSAERTLAHPDNPGGETLPSDPLVVVRP